MERTWAAHGELSARPVKSRRGCNRTIAARPDGLHDTYEATLTLLYRLLFLLYAESRNLLPIREAPSRAASLTKIKEEIADKAGIAQPTL